MATRRTRSADEILQKIGGEREREKADRKAACLGGFSYNHIIRSTASL